MPDLQLVHDATDYWTPGTYLRLRREAAAIAAAAAGRTLKLGMWLEYGPRHIAAEQDRIVLTDAELARLREDFAFEPDIYLRLVQGMPFTALCRRCACSWTDPCHDEVHGPCAWTPGDPTLCTACAGRAS